MLTLILAAAAVCGGELATTLVVPPAIFDGPGADPAPRPAPLPDVLDAPPRPAGQLAAAEVWQVPTAFHDKSMPGPRHYVATPAAPAASACNGGDCSAGSCDTGACAAGACSAGACSSGACMTSGGGSYRMKFRSRGKAGGRRFRGSCGGNGCGY